MAVSQSGGKHHTKQRDRVSTDEIRFQLGEDIRAFF